MKIFNYKSDEEDVEVFCRFNISRMRKSRVYFLSRIDSNVNRFMVSHLQSFVIPFFIAKSSDYPNYTSVARLT